MNSKNMLIYLSKEETMRKLLSDRVGIIRNISVNLVFIPNKLFPEELVQRCRSARY